MKRSDFNPAFDQKWAWPRKTWLQERLKAIKGQQQETHRKSGGTPDAPAVIEAKSTDDQKTKAD